MAKVTQKKKASAAMSRYIRLRDALLYCQKHGIDLRQFSRPEDIIGECCTCGAVKSWFRMDAGHYKSRGSGGMSGVYFDERNVHLQCKRCNGFEGGRPKEYREFMLKRYGQDVLDDIERKHRIIKGGGGVNDMSMKAVEIFYKEKYKRLKQLFL